MWRRQAVAAATDGVAAAGGGGGDGRCGGDSAAFLLKEHVLTDSLIRASWPIRIEPPNLSVRFEPVVRYDSARFGSIQPRLSFVDSRAVFDWARFAPSRPIRNRIAIRGGRFANAEHYDVLMGPKYS